MTADPPPAESEEDTASSPSARKLLVDWANKQDGWVRQIVAEVLAASSGPSATAQDAIFAQYLAEKGLSENSPAADVAPLELVEEAPGQASPLVIKRLAGVRGVNALAEGQEIEFNDHLTILFGENGSGKTGYTRIFKTLGAVRTAERILPNVHEPNTSGIQQAATLGYTVDGDDRSLSWSGEEGVPPFTTIGIFDSPAVRLHVDDDLDYLYTPGDLALFPRVTDGISGIRSRLETAIGKRRPASNPYLSHFTRGTETYALIETLGGATDLAKLRSLGAVDEDADQQLKTLAEQVMALQGQTIGAQLAVARSRRDLANDLVRITEAAVAFDANAYNQAVETAAKADGDHAALQRDLVASLNLEGDEAEQAWRAFILSGDDYQRHLKRHDYPEQGDACLYCQQTLEGSALALVAAYREFANDASRRHAKEARELADTLCRDVAVDHESVAEALAQAKENEKDDPTLDAASRLLVALKVQRETLAAYTPVDTAEVRGLAETVLEQAKARSEAAEKLITSLTIKEGERAEELRKVSAQHNALKDRLELGRRVAEITTYVEDARWAQKADELVKRFRGVLRSLTETAKVASEDLVNNDFEVRFANECKALRAPQVKLDFPGREGRAARRKTVSENYRPSEVLSEGEQKVIALADFLAEASLRLSPTPLVIDDPVTSLDYRRIHEVAARVAELVRHRQVIVFTHNIWFATELLARFESDQARCSYFSVVDNEGSKGIVVPGSHPRWDTIKQTRKRINEAIQSAKTSDGEIKDALIERAYSLIRTWCEIAVESELLAGVTQRYAPNVGMTRLPQIKGERLTTAVGAILPIFEKACRIMEGHSQPLETLAIRPSLETLEADWQSLQDALKAYKDA